MRPRILITTTISASGGFRTEQVMLGSPYIAAVEQPGATALLVSPAHDPDSRDALLEMADGLVLTGGEDVAPARYGQEPHPKLGTTNPARDEMEFALFAAALERGMPVLAICRGLQVVNVALGGTLYQDLPSEYDGELAHEQEAPIDARWHRAAVDPTSRLHEIVGETDLRINSFHHQAVRDLAPGLVVSARAEDGIVEAIESPAHDWLVGVQWHPERGEAALLEDRRHPDRRLFWAFAEACRTAGMRDEG